MLCPKDNIVCNHRSIGTLTIDECPQCGGVWLEQSEVSTLLSSLAMPEASQLDEIFAEWEVIKSDGSAPADFWREDKLICPQDGAQMQKHYFAGTNIGLDQCQVCKGFWFDGGELQAVAAEVVPDMYEKAGQLMIREQIDWQKKMEEVQMKTANVITSLASPQALAFTLANLLVNFIIDRAQFARKQIDI